MFGSASLKGSLWVFCFVLFFFFGRVAFFSLVVVAVACAMVTAGPLAMRPAQQEGEQKESAYGKARAIAKRMGMECARTAGMGEKMLT